MKEIEDKRDQRLRIARAWRTHINEISQSEFEIKEYKAHCTFQVKDTNGCVIDFYWLLIRGDTNRVVGLKILT